MCLLVSKLVVSAPGRTKCCVLEQDTLSILLSAGFYPGRPMPNTKKRRVYM